MNSSDIKILKLNYENYRQRLANATYKESLDISSGCYIDFGKYGLSVNKYDISKKHWKRKTINNWKNLSFPELMKEYKKAEWVML